MNIFKRFIVDSSYAINGAKGYQNKKRFFINLLDNDEYKYKKYFDISMIILIFSSIAILIREVKHELPFHLIFFNSYIISIIFFIEYLLRLWIYGNVTQVIIKRYEYDSYLGREFRLDKALRNIVNLKLTYVFSLRAIIDLLAVLPFFHELRLLRVFILFRVFKLFRYTKSFQTLASVLATKKFEFLTLAMFASIVIFVSSVLIYVMEANNPNSPINTLYEAVYWSIVTISTVGYGDVTPVTDEGRFVAMLVIIAGISVLAFTTSLFVSAFTEKLDEIREMKSIEDIAKIKKFYLVCGYEEIAREVALSLHKRHKHIIVLDENIDNINNAKNDGFIAIHYDPGSIESYKKLNIDIHTQVESVLCMKSDDVQNVYTALTVRSINKEIPILSLLINEVNRKKLQYAGVNEIIYPQELVGMIVKELVGQPVAFEAVHELRTEESSIIIDEIVITESILKNYAMVGELDNKRYRIVLLGVYKKHNGYFYFNPLDETFLEEGDYLLVIGNKVFISDFENSLHKKV
ncbi:MAG: ion transporter [Sulfurimonas sp.]